MQYGCGFVLNEHLLSIVKNKYSFFSVKGMQRLFDWKTAWKENWDEAQKQ